MSAERAQVHYEVFAKRQAASSWALQAATEDRAQALEIAEDLLADRQAGAVRVQKETLDLASGEFRSVVIHCAGAVTDPRRASNPRDVEPLCVSPADLYSAHARERIGRLLEDWLRRAGATPFELLHRPDLAEQLEAGGSDLRHAVQKIAVPEAQARGASVHGLMRAFTSLAERAIEKLVKDGRRGVFPDVAREPFAAMAERLTGDPDRVYLLGGAVAAALASATDWPEKIGRLLDLADAAPGKGPGRTLAFAVLEQPLSELLGERAGLAELLGPDLDLGGSLAALTRLIAGGPLERLMIVEPSLKERFPTLHGPAVRLSTWLGTGAFDAVRAALSRRLLSELTGQRRLRPSSAEGEIELLRALAMGLTAAAGGALTAEDVQAAFVERSRRLVGADFVTAYLGTGRSALGEATALVWLAENVAGGANKRAASRWLNATVGALRFETELRASLESPMTRLQALADLQRGIAAAGLDDSDGRAAVRTLGEAGGRVEADSRLVTLLGRAEAPAAHRLTLLLKMAGGSSAPSGPVTDRARAEANRLMRDPAVRAELAAAPEALARVRGLLDGVALAA